MALEKTKLVRSIAQRSWTAYGAINTEVDVRLGSATIRVPVFGRVGLSNLTFGPADLAFVELLRRTLRTTEGEVLDVGANIGRFLIYLLATGDARSYVGCEPSALCCAYVDRLISANDLRSHLVFPIALADRSGVLEFLSNTDTDVFATTTREFYPSGFLAKRKYALRVTGDELLAQLPGPRRIALAKIDVEGGELDVLRGLTATIERCLPLLLIEVAPARGGHVDEGVTEFRRRRIRELEQVLGDLGYSVFRIRGGGRLEAIATFAGAAESRDIADMDYLCVPAERVDAIGGAG